MLNRLKRWADNVRQAMTPGLETLRGASAGLVLLTVALVAFMATGVIKPGYWTWLPAVIFAVIPILVALLVTLLALLLSLFQRSPFYFRVALLWCVALWALALLFGPGVLEGIWLPFITGGAALMMGGGFVSWWRARRAGRSNRFAGFIAVLGFVTADLTLVYVLLPADRPRVEAPAIWTAAASQAKVEERLDQSGAFAVETLVYGSGTDQRRSHYAAGVAFKTDTVDLSEYLSGWEGTLGKARTWYWGFGPEACPLNARVWYPKGDGPFSLVLIVHGNHGMEEPSEEGYDYLGQFLASHGYILASVDENFLNGSFLDISGITSTEINGENEARGIVLLEHLKRWREWNATPGHVFAGKVDLDHIALIGHSRGGEAVTTAALFNPLKQHPENGLDTFDYGFNIRTVIAIAPVDGQYWPTAAPPNLSGVNYLVLQGQHDGDIRFFMGGNVYDRVELSPGSGLVKAAVNVALANHGQFNRMWGNADIPGIWKHLLNRGTLLPVETQERVAKVVLRSFLDLTLRGDVTRAALFEQPLALAPWCPESPAHVQFSRAEDVQLADYSEDVNLQSGTIADVTLQAEGVAAWKEERIQYRMGTRANNAVALAWGTQEEGERAAASYRASFASPPVLSKDSKILFDLARYPAPESLELPEGLSIDALSRDDLDFSLVLSDVQGGAASITLSAVSPLLPLMEIHHWKRIVRDPLATVESAFQTWAIPVSLWQAANPALDISSITQLSFVFDKSTAGALYLDNLGIR